MGSIVPGLSKEFPHQFVSFYFKAEHSPTLEFSEEWSGALLSASLSVEMRLDNTDRVLVGMGKPAEFSTCVATARISV